jgi:hypothetical protein
LLKDNSVRLRSGPSNRSPGLVNQAAVAEYSCNFVVVDANCKGLLAQVKFGSDEGCLLHTATEPFSETFLQAFVRKPVEAPCVSFIFFLMTLSLSSVDDRFDPVVMPSKFASIMLALLRHAISSIMLPPSSCWLLRFLAAVPSSRERSSDWASK